jgi:hypothetical protein
MGFLISSIDVSFLDEASLAVQGIFFGVSIGLLEWFLLKSKVSWAKWWILATILLGMVGFVNGDSAFSIGSTVKSFAQMNSTLNFSDPDGLKNTLVFMRNGVIGGVVTAVISGLMLGIISKRVTSFQSRD